MEHLSTMHFLRLLKFMAAPVKIPTSSCTNPQVGNKFCQSAVDQIGLSAPSLRSECVHRGRHPLAHSTTIWQTPGFKFQGRS